MLIPSRRHRPADLALWTELEEADLIHGRSDRVANLVSRSLHVIREFVGRGKCYVAVSGGKDSLVTANLVRRVAPGVPLVYLRAIPVANPDNLAVLERLGGAIIADVDYRSIASNAGPWAAETAKDRAFFGVCRQIQAEFGRRILGIRADESWARTMRVRRWGESTTNACAPLSHWRLADVFGYAAAHGLPLHPAYAMLGAGRWPREQIRVDELCGVRGDGHGRAEWEREYYGDELRRFAARGNAPAG